MEEFETLLKPSWGTEKWIQEGWNRITSDEKKSINARLDDLFKDGLPFEIKHDKLLYIYVFSMMAQLEVLGIQLPMRFEKKMQKPEFKTRMRAQLVDEIFHAIALTKIVFLLCAPYGSPPAYNAKIEEVCEFIRAIDCLKVGMVVMNLVCEGLVEEVFNVLYKHDIASELFEVVLADEHRHVCEADLYSEIGLPDKEVLTETLRKFEELLISAFTLEPKYTIAMTALLGHRGVADFITALYTKHVTQLKKINAVPSEQWDIFLKMAPELYSEFDPHSEELLNELDLEIYEVDMTPNRKVLMTQLNDPGDPTLVAQFNIDISAFGFFDQDNPDETLTALMMQAVSLVLASHDSFRNFISYTKLYRTRAAFVAVAEKLVDCGDHVSTVHFRDCHTINTHEITARTNRAIQVMSYCYKKREHVEKEHPELKQRLDDLLYGYAHDVYPCPLPGSYSVYLSNVGKYGYTQVTTPLLKQTGLHVALLAVERKSVWNKVTKSFETKDLLPISISADGRIFDGLLQIPDLLNEAFQTALQTMREQAPDAKRKESVEIKHYGDKIEQMTEDLLTKRNIVRGGKLMSSLIKHETVEQEIKRIFGDDLEVYGEKLSQYSNFKNIANNLLLDYLGFNADEVAKDANFNKIIDKMLAENLEGGYRILNSIQTGWIDYIDVEAAFDAAYKKVAHSRLDRLAKFIPTIGRNAKWPGFDKK
ncbi:MAG: hypothetical protein ACRCXC_07365 [Legionella sp.]